MSNQNLFAALRAAFPADLDAVAVETDNGLCYSWRDLDRASAMVANLLASLPIKPDASGAPPRVEFANLEAATFGGFIQLEMAKWARVVKATGGVRID